MALRSGRILRRGKLAQTELALTELMDKLQKELRLELEQQGHVGRRGKGGLLESIGFETSNKDNRRITYQMKANAYGEKINAQQSPMTVSVGKLIKWMEEKNKSNPKEKFDFSTKYDAYSNKKKKWIAKAIQRSIQQEGVPTIITDKKKKGSYHYSYNGRRLGWIDIPWSKRKIDINKKVLPAVAEDIVRIIGEVLDKVASRNPNLKVER